MHDLEGNRKVFRDQIEEEERERRKLLENELKILEVELTKAKLEKKDATEAHQGISHQLRKTEELLKESNLLCVTLKVMNYQKINSQSRNFNHHYILRSLCPV